MKAHNPPFFSVANLNENAPSRADEYNIPAEAVCEHVLSAVCPTCAILRVSSEEFWPPIHNYGLSRMVLLL